MPLRAKKRYFDPPASGRGQGCPVHALAPPEGVLTPAAAAPAASRQTPAPASTAAGCSITGSGKWLQASAHSGSVRSSQPEPVACSSSTGGGAMGDLQDAHADPPCESITTCSRAHGTRCEGGDTGAPRPSLRAIPDGGIVRLRRQCRIRHWAGAFVGRLQALRHHGYGPERLPRGRVAGCRAPNHPAIKAMRPTPASKTHHGARRSCAWCVSAWPWRATPTVSSGGQRLLPPRQPALGHGLLHLPAVEEAVRERYRLAGHLQGHPARGSVMGLQHLPELLEDAPQPGQVVSRVARGPAVVRPGAVALGSGGLAHAVLLRGLSLLGFVVRLCDVLRVSPFPAHPRRCQRLQATALLAGLRLL